ncbi:hypothetical protein FACS1894187_14740 [Synergistales bacterium]|nr:hypothetical protein FACS1894187_14740 [Synergistales bacterium]
MQTKIPEQRDFISKINKIKKIIDAVGKEYHDNPANILTESDLKCLLYSKLISSPKFKKAELTADGEIKGVCVHTEAPWLDEEGHLAIRPDMCILQMDHLSIINFERYVNVPKNRDFPVRRRDLAKQFSFWGKSIIFELKFCRYINGLTRSFVEGIRKDYEKIEKLYEFQKSRGYLDDVYCFFVVFNKTDRKDPSFDKLVDEIAKGNYRKHLCIVYKTGNVVNPKKRGAFAQHTGL